MWIPLILRTAGTAKNLYRSRWGTARHASSGDYGGAERAHAPGSCVLSRARRDELLCDFASNLASNNFAESGLALALSRQAKVEFFGSLGTHYPFSDGGVPGPCRAQPQDGAGYANARARGGSSRPRRTKPPWRGSFRICASSRVHAFISGGPHLCRRRGGIRLLSLAAARSPDERSQPASAVGTALPLCVTCGAEPHSARFHQQLRCTAVLAVLGEVVFVGHRLHHRTGDACSPHFGSGDARILRLS